MRVTIQSSSALLPTPSFLGEIGKGMITGVYDNHGERVEVNYKPLEHILHGDLLIISNDDMRTLQRLVNPPTVVKVGGKPYSID